MLIALVKEDIKIKDFSPYPIKKYQMVFYFENINWNN